MVSGKRAFSVPIGKLRNKNSRCRASSSSRSSSGLKLLNKLLKKNNQELAYALAKQKERNKVTTDDNVKLMSTLHDSRLETNTWKTKCSETQKLLSEYRNSVSSHIKEAVRYSVLLTESLKLALTVPYPESPSAIDLNRSPSKESVNRTSNIVTPLSLRVNPMVSGHTIRYPTVNLKRLDVEVVERITDENNEEASEEDDDNDDEAEPSEKSESTPRIGLSTCVEEDEEVSQSVACTSSQQMHEDSFRRRTVSFRNKTLDKSKQMWQIEVAESTSSKLNVESREALSPLNSSNRTESISRNHSSDWECVAVPEGLNCLKPVVALNDISELLPCSNTVNLEEMAKLGSKILSMARHHGKISENEKENILSNQVVSKPAKLQRKTKQAVASVVEMVDPLEGTSRMYENHFIKPSEYDGGESSSKKKSSGGRNKEINPKNKKTRKRCRDPETDSSTRNDEWQKESSSNVVDMKEFFSPEKVTKLNENNSSDQEPTVGLDNQRKTSVSLQSNDICCESLNMAQIRIDVRNNLVLQSTPMCRDSSSVKKAAISPSSLSPNVGSHDQSYSVPSLISPSIIASGAAGDIIDGERLSPSPKDAKLLPNAFVTVRVRRLQNVVPIDSEIENQSDAISCAENVTPNSSAVEQEDFVGFKSPEKALGKGKELRDAVTLLSSDKSCASENVSSSYDFTGFSSKTEVTGSSLADSVESNSRPKRKAAPKVLQEPKLNVKMRRSTSVKGIGRTKSRR